MLRTQITDYKRNGTSQSKEGQQSWATSGRIPGGEPRKRTVVGDALTLGVQDPRQLQATGWTTFSGRKRSLMPEDLQHLAQGKAGRAKPSTTFSLEKTTQLRGQLGWAKEELSQQEPR